MAFFFRSGAKPPTCFVFFLCLFVFSAACRVCVGIEEREGGREGKAFDELAS